MNDEEEQGVVLTEIPHTFLQSALSLCLCVCTQQELLRSVLLIQRTWRSKRTTYKLAGAEKALSHGQQQMKQLNSLRIKLDLEAARTSTQLPWHEISFFESVVVWAEQAISIVMAEGVVSPSDVRKSRAELHTFLTEGLVSIKNNIEDQLRRENKVLCDLNDVVSESLPAILMHRRCIETKWKLHTKVNDLFADSNGDDDIDGESTDGMDTSFDIEQGKLLRSKRNHRKSSGSVSFWKLWDTFWLVMVVTWHFCTSLRLQNAFFDEFHNIIIGYAERLSARHPVLVRVLSQQCVQEIIETREDIMGFADETAKEASEYAKRSLLVFNHLVTLRTLQFVLDFVEAQSWGDSPVEKRSALAKIVRKLAEMAANNREANLAEQHTMRKKRRDNRKRRSIFQESGADLSDSDSENSIDNGNGTTYDLDGELPPVSAVRRHWAILRGSVLLCFMSSALRKKLGAVKTTLQHQAMLAANIATREGFREGQKMVMESGVLEKVLPQGEDADELRGVKIDTNASEKDLFKEMNALRKEGKYSSEVEDEGDDGAGSGGKGGETEMVSLPGMAENEEKEEEDVEEQEIGNEAAKSDIDSSGEDEETKQQELEEQNKDERGNAEDDESGEKEDENDQEDEAVQPADEDTAVSSRDTPGNDGLLEALSLSNILRGARLSNIIYSWVVLQTLVTILQWFMLLVIAAPPLVVSVGLIELVQAPWYVSFAPCLLSASFIFLSSVDFVRYNTFATYAREYSIQNRAAKHARRTVDTYLMDRRWAQQQQEWLAKKKKGRTASMRRQSVLGMRDILQAFGEDQCLRHSARYHEERLLRRAFGVFKAIKATRERRLNNTQRQNYLLAMSFQMLKRNAVRCKAEATKRGNGANGVNSLEDLRTRILVIPAFRKWRRIARDHRVRLALRREKTLGARMRVLTWVTLAILLSIDTVVVVLMCFWTIIGTIAQLGRSAAVLTLLFTACFIFFRKWARNSKKRKELMEEVKEKLKAKMDAAKEYKDSFSSNGRMGRSKKNFKLRILDPVVWRKRQVTRIVMKITNMAASMSRVLGSSISKDDLSMLFSKELALALETALQSFHAAISTPRLDALLEKVRVVLTNNTKLPADLAAWKRDGWTQAVAVNFEPLHIARIVDEIRTQANKERDRLVRVQMRFNALTFFEEPQNHSIIASKVYMKIAKRNKRNVWGGVLKALTLVFGAATLLFGLEALSPPGASAKLLQGMFLLLFSGAALAETGGGMEMGGDVDGAVDESFNEEVEGGDEGGDEGEVRINIEHYIHTRFALEDDQKRKCRIACADQ